MILCFAGLNNFKEKLLFCFLLGFIRIFIRFINSITIYSLLCLHNILNYKYAGQGLIRCHRYRGQLDGAGIDCSQHVGPQLCWK